MPSGRGEPFSEARVSLHMRRLAPFLALSLSALPLAPVADAAGPALTAYVVERTDPDAASLTVSGGVGAGDREYALAAVATANTGANGRFTSADGALFFGVTVEAYAAVKTPAGTYRCGDIPVAGTACAGALAGGGIGFAVWWDDAAFDQALVVLRGRGADLDVSVGWAASRWTGSVRVVDNADAASVTTTGGGVAAFAGEATAPGGGRGSVAIAHPPCHLFGIAAPGAGAVALTGGAAPVVAACPDALAPPASAASGATTWKLTGAAAGVSDVPARLVVWSA